MRKIVGILILSLANMSFAEDRFAAVEIKTQQLTDKIYMLIGAGGNIGVSKGSDGLLMIDDQFAPLAPKIKQALSKLGTELPAYLLNTHHHGDHTGGNAAFGTDSLIIAHDNVRLRMVSGTPSAEKIALPVITFEKQARIHFNNEEIQLIHMPNGHTDGDSIVYFTTSNVVHMGDHYFKDRFPYVDLGAGGSVDGMADNIATALALIKDDTQVIPGHGPLANKDDLKRYLAMLNTTSAQIKSAIRKGDSLEAILENGLGSQWDTWGQGFINEESWIQTLYSSYKN